MRVRSPRRAGLVVAVFVAMWTAGCSGRAAPTSDGTVVGSSSTAPAPLPTVAAVASTSTAASVTTDPSPIDVPQGATQLSADGPWRLVDGVPGIEGPGLVYELMPGLHVFLPYERDLAHGVVWTFRERDREVVEDWLRAMLVYYRTVTADPITVGDADWRTWFPVADMPIVDELERRRANGYHVELDQGIVLRPEVLGEQRTDTTAIVFDCEYDGSYVVDRDGNVVPPSFRGFADEGMGYRVERIDGAWRVTAVGRQVDACM